MENRNPVGWFEIYVDDLDKAKRFYQDVFKTELTRLAPPEAEGASGLEMWGFTPNYENYGATGAICKMDGVQPGGMGTTVYFSCEDCSEEQARVEGAGGKVMKSKFSIGEHGFIAMCIDPAGNMIGLHSMK